jgi:hypothetical protein
LAWRVHFARGPGKRGVDGPRHDVALDSAESLWSVAVAGGHSRAPTGIRIRVRRPPGWRKGSLPFFRYRWTVAKDRPLIWVNSTGDRYCFPSPPACPSVFCDMAPVPESPSDESSAYDGPAAVHRCLRSASALFIFYGFPNSGDNNLGGKEASAQELGRLSAHPGRGRSREKGESEWKSFGMLLQRVSLAFAQIGNDLWGRRR